MLTIRKVYKADELKRFKELEGKYHYMNTWGQALLRWLFWTRMRRFWSVMAF